MRVAKQGAVDIDHRMRMVNGHQAIIYELCDESSLTVFVDSTKIDIQATSDGRFLVQFELPPYVVRLGEWADD